MSRQLVHTGRKIRIYVDMTVAPDGTEVRRDVVTHPGAVVVLPVHADGRVVLLRNRRWVVNETLWELPAGTLEPPEPVEAAARRELQEETGYTADRWRPLGFLYASPGVLDEKLHLFVAEGLTPGPQRLEPDEEIVVHSLPLAEAVDLCLQGEIKDAKTITALLLWERLRGERPV